MHKTQQTTDALSRTIHWPNVRSAGSFDTEIKSIVHAKNYTAVEIVFHKRKYKGMYHYKSVNPETYLVANGVKRRLTYAEGIKMYPDYTEFKQDGEDAIFKLFFPSTPESTISLDLIEPSSFGTDGTSMPPAYHDGGYLNFYGIDIRKLP